MKSKVALPIIFLAGLLCGLFLRAPYTFHNAGRGILYRCNLLTGQAAWAVPGGPWQTILKDKPVSEHLTESAQQETFTFEELNRTNK